MKKFIYFFQEGNKELVDLLGGKGANLCEMKSLGLNIPNGIVITTEACVEYMKDSKFLNNILKEQILNQITELELITDKEFGGEKPLLVSVRSGAPVSMPGMMDTILNLGFNDKTLDTLIRISGEDRFPYESYARFIEMFSEIVMKIERKEFEKIKYSLKEENKINYPMLIQKYKSLYREKIGNEFPQNIETQILLAVEAIFQSWNNPRAKIYRKLNNYSDSMGTAVVIQEMVFGNLNSESGTGVLFSRNPSTGENKPFGEYLFNAQGEDIVAGIRTPKYVEELKFDIPEVYNELIEISKKLETHYKDMQDIEFTIENRKLFILQTRNGKRTVQAAVKIASDLVHENLISIPEALMRVEPCSLSKIINGRFSEKALKKATLIGTGLPGSNGVAVGKIALNSSKITKDENWVLVTDETSPEDIEGMNLAQGILTARGGLTSHGAVVARGMGKCCVVGCDDLKLSENNTNLTLGNHTLKEEDFISIDGYTGNVYLGILEVERDLIDETFQEFLTWAKQYKKLSIRANGDNFRDALASQNFGAEGIGLCRTEHMFFEADKILNIRQLILSESESEKTLALEGILKSQSLDFYEIFKTMNGLPVNIRLLDPPLHEFLPRTETDIEILSKKMSLSKIEIKERMDKLKENNPMLGHRGCRLAITAPEIYETQIKAIRDASKLCKLENIPVAIEIMIPFIGDIEELRYIKNLIHSVGSDFTYKIGTMLEIPRACLLADEIAKEVDFFSYGTNDLTQTTLGISRDDSGKFMDHYKEKKIYEIDPFKTIDTKGVGKLLKSSFELGKSSNNNIKAGVCGEHGGDPTSIEFFNTIDLNYVSCSPYRIPVAILAAAQSEIKKLGLI